MHEIGKIADTVMSVVGLSNSDIDTVWDKIDDSIKKGHSLDDVKSYISKKIKQGSSST